MWLVDSLERHLLLEYQTAVMAVAVGASGVEVPDLLERRARFDADLSTAPSATDPADDERDELRLLLGLRGR